MTPLLLAPSICAQLDERPYNLGQALGLMARVKQGAEASTVHALSGRLYLSQSGWILLSVPNALVRGAFDALNEPGAELPVNDGVLNAHISVIRPEELSQIGGPNKITERGHDFAYTLGPLKAVTPLGWAEMSKVWFIEVQSPDLRNLRKSYGLPPLPKGGEFEFHITVGVRRKHVLRNNDTAKFDRSQGTEVTMERVGKAASAIDQLLTAKQQSDRRNYRTKHGILRAMLKAHPEDFEVGAVEGDLVGLTHRPTGFRVHAPAAIIPR